MNVGIHAYLYDIIKLRAASSSGIGDGCYDVYVQHADIEGHTKVVSVSIEFLREGE